MRHDKQKKINKKEKEKKLAKLEKVKALISHKGYNRILDDQKWFSIFEIIDNKRIVFKIKLIIDSDTFYCDFIRELDKHCVLVDDSGRFIKYFEIEYIGINQDRAMIDFLENQKIEYSFDGRMIKISGYN